MKFIELACTEDSIPLKTDIL